MIPYSHACSHNADGGDCIFKAFDGQPLKMLHGGKYLVNTLTDHVPSTSPLFLRQVTNELMQIADFARCDKLVGEEERGGYIAAITAFLVNKPFSLLKWNPLGLEGEACIEFRNAYARGSMYINGIGTGDRVIVVEDFIDTGGTIIALVKLLRKVGAEVMDVLAVAEKVDNQARVRIMRETGLSPKVLVSVSVEGETSRVVGRRTPTAHNSR